MESTSHTLGCVFIPIDDVFGYQLNEMKTGGDPMLVQTTDVTVNGRCISVDMSVQM